VARVRGAEEGRVCAVRRAWRELGVADLRCRSIGVSNFGVEELKEVIKIAHVKPAVNQVRSAFLCAHTDSQALRLNFTRTTTRRRKLLWSTLRRTGS
jgi:diketogulonate reductase-like aldo/keto reductase